MRPFKCDRHLKRSRFLETNINCCFVTLLLYLHLPPFCFLLPQRNSAKRVLRIACPLRIVLYVNENVSKLKVGQYKLKVATLPTRWLEIALIRRLYGQPQAISSAYMFKPPWLRHSIRFSTIREKTLQLQQQQHHVYCSRLLQRWSEVGMLVIRVCCCQTPREPRN